MNQIKIGNFIQTVRKEKGLTQKELAEKLGVSDRAVSKWETGNGMPDISLLQNLCATLEISMNEFLSGQKIIGDDYHSKAEENILQLLKQNKTNRKSTIIFTAIGIILFVAVTVLIFCNAANTSILWFIDLPALIATAGLATAIQFIGFKRNSHKRLSLLRKTIIPCGLVIFLVSLVIILGDLNPEHLGPNIAIALLSLLYSVIAHLVLTIIEHKQD